MLKRDQIAACRFFIEPAALAPYRNYRLTGFQFSRAGDSMYMLLAQGRIVEFDPAGNVIREIRLRRDLFFGEAVACDVDPSDGRLWIADDSRDQIWSVDPSSGRARLEISLN